MLDLIFPEWPTPKSVTACTTTRRGGVSLGPYAALNLSSQVGDLLEDVVENRRRLRLELDIPGEPIWIRQVHGTKVIKSGEWGGLDCQADAVYSKIPGEPCMVMTADCLPLLLCSRSGREVAAVHAGWRGLDAGVIEAALSHFEAPPGELLVWLGPAIGPQAFVVDGKVRQRFCSYLPLAVEAFTPTDGGLYLADIYLLARQRLHKLGVRSIYGGNRCTYSEPEEFFSYRRENCTGRMASIIWFS